MPHHLSSREYKQIPQCDDFVRALRMTNINGDIEQIAFSCVIGSKTIWQLIKSYIYFTHQVFLVYSQDKPTLIFSQIFGFKNLYATCLKPGKIKPSISWKINKHCAIDKNKVLYSDSALPNYQ